MDLCFFLNVFKRRWRIIFCIACFVAIATGLYCKLFIDPVYRSAVTLYFGKITDEDTGEPINTEKHLNQATSQLALGSQVTSDYSTLINFEVINNGVEDELRKLENWQDKSYKASVSLTEGARMMVINIDSTNPFFCQEVANIYARKFISKAEQLIGVQNIQIIEEATLNFTPISPKIQPSVLFSFIGGLILAMVFAVLHKMLDRTIYKAEEVEKVLDVPVIGTVRKDHNYDSNTKLPLLWDKEKNNPLTPNKITDDFRVFRVNLINRKSMDGKDGEGSVIVMTSTFPKEGKTFCTANLGASLAEAGYKVLLVDCDNEKFGLQNCFEDGSDEGLMNVLSSKDIKFENVVKHNVNNLNLDVLFCGSKDVVASNLMISPDFKELMSKVKKQYDYTLLDVSTNLGVADLVSAGSSADSVLLLVQAGKTKSEMMKKTAQILKRANLDISGVILNGTDE